MIKSQRILALSLVGLAMVAACKKKQADTGVVPVSTPPSETCDQRCRDSIAADAARRAAAARQDSINAANEARNRALAAVREAVAAKVYFDYDASDLSSEARAVLDAKLAIFQSNPGLRIRVAGHADERGSDEYNLALGQRRAVAVKRYLTDQGIDPSRIDVVSYGEERPEVTDGTEAGYRMNRRAEFEITAGGETLVPPR
jgi:peptidoglycan-associated lipoprotein